MTGERQNAGAYQKLKSLFSDINALEKAAAILEWDMVAQMRGGSSDDRDHQLETLAAMVHDKLTAPQVADWLDEAEAGLAGLSTGDQANLRHMRHTHAHSTALPADLVRALTSQAAEGQRLHKNILKSGNWEDALPVFQNGLNLARDQGAAIQSALGLDSPYAGLLNAYCPDMGPDELDREMQKLEPTLKRLLPEVIDQQSQGPQPLPIKTGFSRHSQKVICERICTDLGFDFDRGRLDFIDDHPASYGTPDDSRITARFSPNNFLQLVYDTIHEVGHGCYEQGLPKDWRNQPAGGPMGMDIHESQSLMYEFQLGKSEAFCKYLSALLKPLADDPSDPALEPENLHALQTRVVRSPIRISMDTSELTYPLHIMLRYKLEKDMISGDLDPADLPDAWNAMMQDYMGVTPQTPQESHIQDVHWFVGYWGYFPTYLLGAMGTAQLYDAAKNHHPNMEAGFATGDFQPLIQWLRDNVHSKGSLLTTSELFRQSTGQELHSGYYLEHLTGRYNTRPPVQATPQVTQNNPGGSKLDFGS